MAVRGIIHVVMPVKGDEYSVVSSFDTRTMLPSDFIHPGPLAMAAVSDEYRTLVVAAEHRRLALLTFDTSNNKIIEVQRLRDCHATAITGISVCPGRQLSATTSSQDGHLIIKRLPDDKGALQTVNFGKGVLSCSLHPGGYLAAVAGDGGLQLTEIVDDGIR